MAEMTWSGDWPEAERLVADLRAAREETATLRADLQRALARIAELEAENARLRARLRMPCPGCPGCSTDDCPDARDIAETLRERIRSAHGALADAGDIPVPAGPEGDLRAPIMALVEQRERPRPVVDAALAWWLSKRPEWWDEAEHRRYPAVNCPTECEKSLARAVASYEQLKAVREDQRQGDVT